MDVGQIKGNKSGKGKKGKGKDGKSSGKHVKGKVKSEKGSGNEKSGGNVQAPAQFQGYCGFCEKWGLKTCRLPEKTARARTIINAISEISVSVAKFEFCR